MNSKFVKKWTREKKSRLLEPTLPPFPNQLTFKSSGLRKDIGKESAQVRSSPTKKAPKILWIPVMLRSQAKFWPRYRERSIFILDFKWIATNHNLADHDAKCRSILPYPLISNESLGKWMNVAIYYHYKMMLPVVVQTLWRTQLLVVQNRQNTNKKNSLQNKLLCLPIFPPHQDRRRGTRKNESDVVWSAAQI